MTLHLGRYTPRASAPTLTSLPIGKANASVLNDCAHPVEAMKRDLRCPPGRQTQARSFARGETIVVTCLHIARGHSYAAAIGGSRRIR
jgi:hypothetical protein